MYSTPQKSRPSEPLTTPSSLEFSFPIGVTLVRTRQVVSGRLLLAVDVNLAQFRQFLESNDFGDAVGSCTLVDGEIWLDEEYENSKAEIEIHAAGSTWFAGAFLIWKSQLSPLGAEVQLYSAVGGTIAEQNQQYRPDVKLVWQLPENLQRTVLVEISYGVGLRATHARMAEMLTKFPQVAAGIIVRIRYPLASDGEAFSLNNNYFVFCYYSRPVEGEQVRATRMISFGDFIGHHDSAILRGLVNADPLLEMEGNCFGVNDAVGCTPENAGHAAFNHQLPAELTFSLNGDGTILNNYFDVAAIPAGNALNFRLYDLKEYLHTSITLMNENGIPPPNVPDRVW